MRLIAITALLLMNACGGSDTTLITVPPPITPPVIPLVSVAITPGSLTLGTGGSLQFSAAVTGSANGVLDAAHARLRLLFRRDDAESRMKQAMEFHIAMETNRLMHDEQLAPSEARRRALVVFGGVEKHEEELRSTRGLVWMSGPSLDLKLGFRMLIEYPGLTIVSCLARSTAIAASSAYLEVMNDTISPALPGHFDQRIVRIRSWDVMKNELDPASVCQTRDHVARDQPAASQPPANAKRLTRAIHPPIVAPDRAA